MFERHQRRLKDILLVLGVLQDYICKYTIITKLCNSHESYMKNTNKEP